MILAALADAGASLLVGAVFAAAVIGVATLIARLTRPRPERHRPAPSEPVDLGAEYFDYRSRRDHFEEARELRRAA